jgi:hypothetical protein
MVLAARPPLLELLIVSCAGITAYIGENTDGKGFLSALRTFADPGVMRTKLEQIFGV